MDLLKHPSGRRSSRSPNLQQRSSLRVDTSSHAERPLLSPRTGAERNASRSPDPNAPTIPEEYAVGSPTSIEPEAGPSRYLERTASAPGSSTSSARYGPSRNSYSNNGPPSPVESTPMKSWRRWSKGRMSTDFEAASLPSRDLTLDTRSTAVNLNAIMRSKLARTVMSAFLLLFFVFYTLGGGPRKQELANQVPIPMPSSLWSGGAGTQRDIHQNLANPESIPYHELTNLTSSLDPADTRINISVLLIPSSSSTPADITAHIQHFSTQTRQPASFLLPDSYPQRLLIDVNSFPNVHPFSDSTSHFTLALPLSSHTLAFGPSTLQYLLHLAHTREFSGALLELGCAQAVFAQTAWINKLDISAQTSPEGKQHLWWRRTGLSSLRVPVADQEEANDNEGFYIDGLDANCAPSKIPAGQSQGRILFMFEPDTSQWEDGWQELACDFLRSSAKVNWASQVVMFNGIDAEDIPDLSCGRRGSVPSMSIDYADWLRDTSGADVIIYTPNGFVEQSLRLVSEADRPWVAIGLPQRDLASAAFIAALEVEAVKNWHVPKIDVVVITNNRPHSLDRLLDSLKATHYFGDTVSMSVSMEQTADPTTHRMIGDVRWPHGPLHIRHRIMLGGLMPAIVESWYPPDNDTYGVFLEDDVEVSPLFYAWLKFTLLQYRYTVSGRATSQRLFGVSLYQPKSVELRPEGRRPFDAHNLFADLSLPHNSPYLSQVPCSWGAAYFPETWREFHQYLSLRLSEHSIDISDTIVPDVRSNRWPRSWKKYFIELVYLRGYMMLYPNYPHFESFSTNHLEMGTHVHVAEVDMKRKVQFTVPLMSDDDPLQLLNLPGNVLPKWPFLPVLDLWGTVTTEEEAIYRGYAALQALGNCAESAETRAYDLAVAPTHDAEELLCPRQFEPALDLDAFELDLDE